MPLTDAQRSELQAVNTRFNAIPYQALGIDAAEDIWIEAPVPGQVFECRDYVLAKAKALRAAGWAQDALTVVLCYTEPAPQREYHAVLAVDTGDETWILDSRFEPIYRWDQPPADYQWDRRQVPGTTGFRSIASA